MTAEPRDPAEKRRQKVERFRENLAARMDEIFKGRTFNIIREVHLPEGQVFRNVMGKTGRHGYIIQDRVNGEKFVVGWNMLVQIHERYLGVNLPTGPRIHPGNPMRRLN